MFKDLSPELLTLWPNLSGALFALQRREGVGAIFFFSADDQARSACQAIANCRDWPIVTSPSDQTVSKFRSEIVDPLVEPNPQRNLFASQPAGLTVLVPDFDVRPESIHGSMKFLFEHAKLPYLLLGWGVDEEKLPSYLRGHYFPCHKKGAPLGSHHRDRQESDEG